MAEHLGQNSFRYAGHHFEWTDLHLPEHETRHLRHDYDQLGSLVVEKLQTIAKAKEAPKPERPGPVDLYSVLRDHHQDDDALEALWTEVHTVPDWVDWEQLERGQKFFYRYAMANLMGFALQGFVGENTASSSVVEVLVRTGGFSIRALRRRLMSTFQLILQVTNSIDCLRAGGAGHTTAVRVRLLHAAVRNRIMKLAESKPDYFSVGEFGVPINTLDSIHSIATFCCNHMWLQLPQQGVYPEPQEIADYIALWRYIGYLLATPHEYFDSTARAKATMESMLVTELRLTPTSDIVCHNFVEFLTDLPPFNISAQFIEAGSRRMNGNKFCDALGFGRPGWYAHACFQGHCWLVRGLALVQQHFPPADRYLTSWFRTNLHQGIIHSRAGLSGGSKFSFKYVPQLGQLTGKETATWHDGKVSFYQRPIELFFFGVFSSVCLTIPLSLCALWQLKRFVFA